MHPITLTFGMLKLSHSLKIKDPACKFRRRWRKP